MPVSVSCAAGCFHTDIYATDTLNHGAFTPRTWRFQNESLSHASFFQYPRTILCFKRFPIANPDTFQRLLLSQWNRLHQLFVLFFVNFGNCMLWWRHSVLACCANFSCFSTGGTQCATAQLELIQTFYHILERRTEMGGAIMMWNSRLAESQIGGLW